MELDYFKDKIFELLNDADNLAIKDIEANDRENKLRIQLQDGNVFEIACRQLKAPANTRNLESSMRVCWVMSAI